jgi:hypothetical protein
MTIFVTSARVRLGRNPQHYIRPASRKLTLFVYRRAIAYFIPTSHCYSFGLLLSLQVRQILLDGCQRPRRIADTAITRALNHRKRQNEEL